MSLRPSIDGASRTLRLLLLLLVGVTLMRAFTALLQLILGVLTSAACDETLDILLRDLALVTTDSGRIAAHLRCHNFIFDLQQDLLRCRPLIVLSVEVVLRQ